MKGQTHLLLLIALVILLIITGLLAYVFFESWSEIAPDQPWTLSELLAVLVPDRPPPPPAEPPPAGPAPGPDGFLRRFGSRAPAFPPVGQTAAYAPPRGSTPPSRSVPLPASPAGIAATAGVFTAVAPGGFTLDCEDAGQPFDFMAPGAGFDVFLGPGEVALSIRRPELKSQTGSPITHVYKGREIKAEDLAKEILIHIRLQGMNPGARPAGVELASRQARYFVGADPRQWITDLPGYARARYQDVWPNVDLDCYGDQSRFELVFVVWPGGDPRDVRLSYEGVDGARVDGAGNLVLDFEVGRLTQRAPIVYRATGGYLQEVTGEYLPRPNGEIQFNVTPLRKKKSGKDRLAPDYLTFLGGVGEDRIHAIATDVGGYAYVTGETSSPGFPGTAAGPTNRTDASCIFVTKFRIADSQPIYTAFIGGGGKDRPFGIAADKHGCAYVCGETLSTNFPSIKTKFGGRPGGNWDAFVLKLSPRGDAVDYSARFGGSGDDRAYGIAVDSGTNVYLAGETLSADFPFTGSLKPGHGPGTWDGFAVKLDASAEFFHYAVCIGGKGEDRACGIGVDPMGCAYVAGATTSRDLPVRGKLPSRHGGGNWDAFVVKLTPDGRDTRYVMYFGGSNDDLASAIAVDAAGNAYVAGETASRDLPATNAVQPRHAGGEWDGFLLKLMGEDPAPVFATCFGGGGIDRVFSVAASAEGSAVIAGSTTSTNLPVVDAFQTRHAGGDSDGFVARFTPSGERLVCSTYLGGPNADALYGVAVDPSRGANFAGATSSTNLPTVNALQSRHFGGGLDGLAGKFPVDYSPEPPLRLVPAGGQPSGPSHDFFMGKYEVTNEEYVRFLNDAQVHTNDVLGANLYFDPEGSLWFNPAMQRQHHEIFNIRQSRILYHPDYPPGCRYNVSPLVPGVGGAYSNHPVVGVSWYGAVKYCNWLTIESGRGESQRCYREGTNAWDWAPVTAPATNWTRGFFSATERDAWLRFQGFRLPMDHCSGNESVPNQYNEFLKSASWAINTNTLYGFGRSKLEGGAANYLNHNPGLKQDTTPVGFFDGTDHGGILRTLTNENRYGIFDLSGNVDEWLNDPGLTNSLLERASCGGSWMFALPTLRNRHFVAPHFTDSFRGFRVMTVAPSPSLYLVRIPFFICVGACSPPSVKPPEKEPPGKPPLPPQEEARKPTTLTVKRLEQVGAMGLLRVPPPSIPAKKEEEVGRQQRGDAQMRSTQAAGWPNTGSSRPPRRAVGSVLSLRQRRLNLAVQYVPSKLVTPLESPGAEL